MTSLTLNTRKIIMKSLSYRRLETSDYWEYAVSRSWLQYWYASFSEEAKSVDDKTHVEPRLRPVTMATNDVENEYLPESQWRIYVDWFGLDSTHELRRRPIYCSYMSLEPSMNLSGDFVIADNELDVLPIYANYLDKVVTSSDNSPMLSIYAWESFTYISKQVKSVLAINKSSSIRLWLCLLDKQNSGPVVIEPILAEEHTLLSKLIEVVPSVRSVMVKRNTQLNPNYVDNGKGKGPERRKGLWDDISVVLNESKPCIAIGVEIRGRRVENVDVGVDDDEMCDSIVTISSIRNEWEDLLTQHVEQYTDGMSKCTDVLKEKIVHSAKEIVGEKMEEINEIRTDYEKRFTMLEERETAIRIKENKLNEKEAYLASRLSNYTRGLDDLQKQKKKFEADVECIQELNKLAGSRIVLNVGGIVYTTSVTTLTKEEGLLSQMFSENHALQKEADGTYFIDRDGVNFRYILNYLRDGSDSIDALEKDDKIIREVLIEAKYYKLINMGQLLQTKMSK